MTILVWVLLQESQRAIRRARAGGPPLRTSNHGVNALEDKDKDYDLDKWIFQTISGGLSNWEAKDFLPISFIQE